MSIEVIFFHGVPSFPDYLSGFLEGQFPENIKATFYNQARG